MMRQYIKTYLCILFILFFEGGSLLYAQNYHIKGRVLDGVSQTSLVGATLLDSLTRVGAVSNYDGEFNLALPKGEVQLKIAFIGYESIREKLILRNDTTLVIYLYPTSENIDEVVVNASTNADAFHRSKGGEFKLSAKEIEAVPTLLGEADLVKTLSYSPGIQSESEGNSGLFIRGGGIDQNVILYDGVPVVNPTHALGFISVFNSDVIESVNLNKSSIASEYGGGISALIDIRSADGDYQNYHGRISAGLISSKLAFNGPLIKDKLSFNMAFRRSYIDEVVKPIGALLISESDREVFNSSQYRLQDVNAKLSFRSDKNRLSLSFYGGGDLFRLWNKESHFSNDINWGNSVASLDWLHYFSDRSILRLTTGITRYFAVFEANVGTAAVDLSTGLENNKMKAVHSIYFANDRTLKYGFELDAHRYMPNKLKIELEENSIGDVYYQDLYDYELAPFISWEQTIQSKLDVYAGVRYVGILNVGPYNEIDRNESNQPIDSTRYAADELIQSYWSLEPRISLNYRLSEKTSLKTSYTIMSQALHLASSSAVSMPVDMWLPTSQFLGPQKASQVSLGFFMNTKSGWTFSSEVYYKEMQNQVELLYGIGNSIMGKSLEDALAIGSGYAKGVEFLLRRRLGAWSGWIGYTLSSTQRKFNQLNKGRLYPASNDRTHDINAVLNWKINTNWQLGTNFVFVSGKAVTIPVQKYMMAGQIVNIYSGVNEFRLPAYHRLDASLTYSPITEKRYKSSWNFSIFNLYNHLNPFYFYFQVTGNLEDYNLSVKAKQVSISPIMPSVTYTLKF